MSIGHFLTVKYSHLSVRHKFFVCWSIATEFRYCPKKCDRIHSIDQYGDTIVNTLLRFKFSTVNLFIKKKNKIKQQQKRSVQM